MPYERLSDAAPAILSIEPPVTLAQANLIVSWIDEIEQSDADVESPWAVGLSQFRKAFHVEDGKWIKNKPVTKEASFDERIRHIRDAWQAQFSARDAYAPAPSIGVDPWPEEVFEDRLTVSTPRGLLAYPYTIGDEGIVEFGEPVQVKARKAEEPGTEVVQGALAKFFESLTGFVTEAAQKFRAKEGGTREAARETQEKFKIGEHAEKSLFHPVVKGRDGSDWWVAYSGTAFEDLEHEIISRKAIDFGIAYAESSDERGVLQLFHLPGSRVGTKEVQLREGCFLIEAGRWDETDVAVAAKNSLRKHPEAWKTSVGFEYNEDYFIGGVYTDQVRFLETSIVGANRAANPFTAIIVAEEAEMSTKEDLLALLEDEDLVNKVLELAAKKTDELSQLVAFKQKSDDDGAGEPEGVLGQIDEMEEAALKELQDAIEAKLRGEAQGDDDVGDKDKVGPSVVEISEDVIKAIAAEVTQAVDFETKLAAMNEQLGALSLTVEAQGATVTGVKQLLETGIEGEVDRRVKELPTSRFVLAEKDKLFRQSQEAPDGVALTLPVPYKSPLTAFGQVYDAMQSKK